MGGETERERGGGEQAANKEHKLSACTAQDLKPPLKLCLTPTVKPLETLFVFPNQDQNTNKQSKTPPPLLGDKAEDPLYPNKHTNTLCACIRIRTPLPPPRSSSSSSSSFFSSSSSSSFSSLFLPLPVSQAQVLSGKG